MASSSFKSTSKRGNLNHYGSNHTHKAPHPPPPVRKRCSSVSAISRRGRGDDISTDFSNKRDNPLFWTSNSSPTDNQEIPVTTFPTDHQENGAQRGRSVTRISGVKNGIGRSVSRFRGRSVSRSNYESQKEQEVANVASSRNSDLKQFVYDAKKTDNMVRNGADIREQIRDSQRMNSPCQANDCLEDDSACSFRISNWEDGISIASLSEAEEKTTNTVCKQIKSFQDKRWGVDAPTNGIYETVRSEVRRAISDIQNDIESVIRRNNVNVIANSSVSGIPPDLVNPVAVEFVVDIKRQYARQLEESEERARKLRADLAVEEHRGQELSRILQEILPDLKKSNPQTSCVGRKRSSERKKISKRLTEEAMAYFDECVSISTFDSSDFSAPEDLPRRLAGPPNLISGTVSVPGGSSSINLPLDVLDSYSNNQQAVPGGNDQRVNSYEVSDLTATSSNYEPTTYQLNQKNNSRGNSDPHPFSFAQKPKENCKFHDIKSYIKHFERGVSRNMVSADGKGPGFFTDDHDLHGHLEKLFDTVFSRNRVEAGGLHLCAGNLAVSFSPFSFVL